MTWNLVFEVEFPISTSIILLVSLQILELKEKVTKTGKLSLCQLP